MQRWADVLRQRMRMVREDALAVAHVLDEAFQGAEEVEDEALDAELRQLFYDLQDAKVLDVKRREYRDPNGRLLRGYRWHILENEVSRLPATAVPQADPLAEFYDGLQRDAWERRRPTSPA